MGEPRYGNNTGKDKTNIEWVMETNEGQCDKSNAFFAELYDCSNDTISRSLRQLEIEGCITTRFVGKKRTIKTNQTITTEYP